MLFFVEGGGGGRGLTYVDSLATFLRLLDLFHIGVSVFVGAGIFGNRFLLVGGGGSTSATKTASPSLSSVVGAVEICMGREGWRGEGTLVLDFLRGGCSAGDDRRLGITFSGMGRGAFAGGVDVGTPGRGGGRKL